MRLCEFVPFCGLVRVVSNDLWLCEPRFAFTCGSHLRTPLRVSLEQYRSLNMLPWNFFIFFGGRLAHNGGNLPLPLERGYTPIYLGFCAVLFNSKTVIICTFALFSASTCTFAKQNLKKATNEQRTIQKNAKRLFFHYFSMLLTIAKHCLLALYAPLQFGSAVCCTSYGCKSYETVRHWRDLVGFHL